MQVKNLINLLLRHDNLGWCAALLFLADWICNELKFDAKAIRDFGLRDANDEDIFKKAKVAKAIVMTKDIDFKILQDRYGSPPKIIWLTCGNTSNKRLKEILISYLYDAIELLNSGETIVEISGDWTDYRNKKIRSKEKPLNEINEDAIILLSKKIGIVNTFRFINQFSKGNNDYTEQWRKLYKNKTLQKILTSVKKVKRKKTKIVNYSL